MSLPPYHANEDIKLFFILTSSIEHMISLQEVRPDYLTKIALLPILVNNSYLLPSTKARTSFNVPANALPPLGRLSFHKLSDNPMQLASLATRLIVMQVISNDGPSGAG